METTTLTAFAFVIITITTALLFYLASHKNKKALTVIMIYMLAQGLLSYFGFYNTHPVNPLKIPVVIAPSFVLLFYILLSSRGKKFIETLNLKTLTLLHTIRIPVELVLFLLYTQKAIPEIMTFAGRNFDILAGITAPMVYYLAFVKNKIGPKALLVWNVISLGLLINIIIHAVLSMELPIQQFGFDQPNKAILTFPYNWLATIVVPIVFFSHCATIQRLLNMKTPDPK